MYLDISRHTYMLIFICIDSCICIYISVYIYIFPGVTHPPLPPAYFDAGGATAGLGARGQQLGLHHGGGPDDAADEAQGQRVRRDRGGAGARADCRRLQGEVRLGLYKIFLQR